MKKERNSWIELAPDAIMGYAAIGLGMLCFTIFLAAVVAIVRFLVGAGAV